jgi:hypothetical protein
MLVWADAPQLAFVGHHDPRELVGSYELAAQKETLDRMAELLESVSVEAAGQ